MAVTPLAVDGGTADADGAVDTNTLFRAAMRHDGVSWQPWTPQESNYRKLAVYVAAWDFVFQSLVRLIFL